MALSRFNTYLGQDQPSGVAEIASIVLRTSLEMQMPRSLSRLTVMSAVKSYPKKRLRLVEICALQEEEMNNPVLLSSIENPYNIGIGALALLWILLRLNKRR